LVAIFKQKSQANAFVLLIYALVLKFSIFIHPSVPTEREGDSYLFTHLLMGLISLFKGMPVFFSVITFLLLFTQATLFNRICNHQKIFPKTNFLPGMSYILITSLIPSWNYFSAPLLVNSIMIWVFYQMTELYNTNRSDASIFNIGALTGLVTLIYQPAISFLLLLFFALLVMRPFRVREWVMGVLGFTSPYYFLFLILYLSNQWNWKNVVPSILFRLPAIPTTIWITCGILLLIVPFLIGGFFVQANLNKMLIQYRKNWSLLLFYLIVAVLIILIDRSNYYENWIVTAVPFAAFHAAAYFYSNDKVLLRIMHWVTFVFILWMNYLA
jgi:hypothetical protein